MHRKRKVRAPRHIMQRPTKALLYTTLLITIPILQNCGWSERPNTAGLAPSGKTRSGRKIEFPSSIWMGPEEIAALPMSGPAWEQLKTVALRPAARPKIRDQNAKVDVQIMAKALVLSCSHGLICPSPVSQVFSMPSITQSR